MEKLPRLVIWLIMYCLSFLIFVSTISGDCWAEDFIIAIDIGHTINTPGATSARGVPEFLFNQNIGTLLHKQLRQDKRFKGSFIINETGEDISLSARAAIANQRGAHLLVSIHHDSVHPKDLSPWLCQGSIMPHCDKFTGYSIFYSEKNRRPLSSLIFAVILGSEMLQGGFCPTLHHAEYFRGGDKDLIDKTRGIYKYNNLVVLKEAKMPAVLFECGIIKNRNEELILGDPEYQHKMVVALFHAIKLFCSQPNIIESSQNNR
ncbi:MAG: N-acetylmuramoyl-L-alanine amidase [Deltaproteobacteria bacterium]|nr:N-acetylmuramoyl-L-alanine amidase [Deltaproteobacteria bacterium]